MPIEDYLELWDSYYQNQLCPETGDTAAPDTDAVELRTRPADEH